MTREYRTGAEGDTRAFARAMGSALEAGDTVLLSGELGAGKSVMARGVASALGIDQPMPSPSFPIMIPYEGRDGIKLYHFDLYRLADPEEFYAAGLDEFVGGDGICVMEWPEMGGICPEPRICVRIDRGDGDEERIISVECAGVDHAERISKAIEGWRWDA